MNRLRHTFVIGLLALTSLASAAVLSAETPPAAIAPDQLVQQMEKKDANLLLLDVRTPEEFAAGHIPGAVNIPHDQLPNRLAELAGAKNKEVVVYCRSGRRSAIAQETLSKQGFTSVKHLEGDMLKWQEDKRPTVK
jgi:rhodanese-related sulfurtransferase